MIGGRWASVSTNFLLEFRHLTMKHQKLSSRIFSNLVMYLKLFCRMLKAGFDVFFRCQVLFSWYLETFFFDAAMSHTFTSSSLIVYNSEKYCPYSFAYSQAFFKAMIAQIVVFTLYTVIHGCILCANESCV